MSESLPAITLPPAQNPQQEGEWLQEVLQRWLDKSFWLSQLTNCSASCPDFVRQRMEGENDLGSRDCDRDRDASV